MVKRRGKKPPSSSSVATNNNGAASTNTSDEEINRINAVINSKQKTWLERLNSNDPHQREDGCDDITTMVSSSSLANNIDQLMQSLFQSGVLITLVKILLTDTEANVRISAASALQNIAAVGRDNTINALIGLTVPSSSSSSNNDNNNNTTSFVSALLNLLGETFQVLEDSIGHLKRYNEYQQKKRQLEQQQQQSGATTATIPENEIVPHPSMHPDTPSRLLTELLGLCSVLVTTNTNNSVSNQLAQSTQLLTALTKTTIDSGFGADEIRSSVAKYYPISSQESLACSCSELLYVLANQLATTNNNPVANFLSNSVPEQYRTKIDSLISLSSSSSSSSSSQVIEEMISKSPSRLCVSLYLAGTFIHSFPSQSLRVVPLLAFCIKGESVIKVTSDALPLLSARSVNETHHRMQRQMKERQEQQQTLPEFANKKKTGGANQHQSDDDDEEDEDDLVDDRETQLRQGPFRSLKVFHTAFTIANDVLNYVAEGDLPETEYLDDDNNNNEGADESIEILEETDDDGSGDEVMKFVNCGAYEAFQKVGLLSACLMRCGEIVNLPSDVVLRSALFDPSTNGHVMNLQSNFHSTVTAILRFNAMLLVLLPFEPVYSNNNNDSSTQQQLTAFLSRVPIMWSSAFEGVNDRLNALNYTKTQIQNNNNSGDCASNLWFGITENLYLQIQNLIRMLFFIQKKSNSVSSSSSSAVAVTPEPKQVDLLRTVFFDERYSGITSETRVDITGLMGQIALSAAKHNQVDALGSCTKFLVETLNTAVGRCGASTSSSSTTTGAENEEAIDVAAEAADLLMDVFNDERFDADVYRVQQVHGALKQFHPLLRPYASTKGLKRKSPRYQELNAVFRNLGGFLEYKVQNGAA